MRLKAKSFVIKTFLLALLSLLTLSIEPFFPPLMLVGADHEYEIKIECSDYWQETYPGNTITFNLIMKNPSSEYDEYKLYIEDLPENWTARFYVWNKIVRGIGLRGGQTVTIYLQVKVPEDAAPGDHIFTVYANGTYTLAKRELIVTVERKPKVVCEVEIYSPVIWQATYPGENVTFNIRIKNLSPHTDTYFLYIKDPPLPENWTTRFYIGQNEVKAYSVHPNESASLTLLISVPESAVPGDYRFRVWAEGDYANASEALMVTVRPSPPVVEPEVVCEVEVYSPVTWKVAHQCENVTFNIRIKNLSPYTDTYFLYVKDPSLPENWTVGFHIGKSEVKTYCMHPNESITLTLRVSIPEDAAPGDYRFRVWVEGIYANASEALTITVKPSPTVVEPEVVCEVEVYSPVTWQVTYPGKNVTFNIRIKNLSPYTDTYFLYVKDPSLPENWTARFYIGQNEVKAYSVHPNESASLTLLVSIPEDATSGDHRFRVWVEGSYANASEALTITVRPLPPIERKIALICPFPVRSVLTGQNASFAVKIENEGEADEIVLLEANVTQEMMYWDVSLSESKIKVNAGEGKWVMLKAKSPEIVKPGDYHINVTATTEDGELNVTLPLTVRVLAHYMLEIVGIEPVNPQVVAGESGEISITVRNIGRSTLSKVRLKINSTIPNILVTPLDVLALEPGETTSFMVRVSPNVDMTQGDYLISVQAVSDETKSSMRTLVVTVVSAIPWFEITIGITVIATALAVIAIMKVISKYGIRLKRKG